MRAKRNARKGFTLIEVIVVLVILALLAAVMIPAMTGWIDKAKEKRLVVACRACVMAAQTLAVEQYGISGAVDALTPTDVKTLARVPGEASGITFEEKTVAVSTLTYQDGTDAVTYERMPTPHYTFNAGGAHSFDKKADMDNINKVLGKISATQINSAAADIADTFASVAVKELKDEGIDLTALGAEAWLFKGHKAGNMFIWTTYDIADLPVGTQIPVIRYRPDGNFAGQYSVWMATVESGSMGKKDEDGSLIYKNVINNNENSHIEKTKGLSKDEKMDLDTVLAVYNSLLPVKPAS